MGGTNSDSTKPAVAAEKGTNSENLPGSITAAAAAADEGTNSSSALHTSAVAVAVPVAAAAPVAVEGTTSDQKGANSDHSPPEATEGMNSGVVKGANSDPAQQSGAAGIVPAVAGAALSGAEGSSLEPAKGATWDPLQLRAAAATLPAVAGNVTDLVEARSADFLQPGGGVAAAINDEGVSSEERPPLATVSVAGSAVAGTAVAEVENPEKASGPAAAEPAAAAVPDPPAGTDGTKPAPAGSPQPAGRPLGAMPSVVVDAADGWSDSYAYDAKTTGFSTIVSGAAPGSAGGACRGANGSPTAAATSVAGTLPVDIPVAGSPAGSLDDPLPVQEELLLLLLASYRLRFIITDALLPHRLLQIWCGGKAAVRNPMHDPIFASRMGFKTYCSFEAATMST